MLNMHFMPSSVSEFGLDHPTSAFVFPQSHMREHIYTNLV